MREKLRIVILVLVFVGLPWLVATPCGYYPPPFRGYTLFNSDILNTAEKLGKPFVFTESFSTYFYYENFEKKSKADENIEEWKNYFCGLPEYDDINWIIYYAGISDLKILKQKEQYRDFVLPDFLKNNTVANHLSKFEHSDFLDYLIFAKKCQPIVSLAPKNKWRTDTKISADDFRIAELNLQGRINYAATTDDFIKLRYGFQLVRLAHYFEGNPVATYEELIEPLQQVSSILRYWAMSHKAGALVKSKNFEDKIEGNYLFSKVIANANFRAGAHYRSMNIATNEEWKAVLKRCETDQERATLHYIRALDVHSKANEEMEAIYDLYPDAKILETLLFRELQKLEAALLTYKFAGFERLPRSVKGIPENRAKAYLKKMKMFVKKAVSEEKVARLTFWKMADGYLEFLDGNLRTAQQILKNARKDTAKKDVLDQQIEVLQFTLLLSIMNTVEPWMEEWLGQLLANNQVIIDKFGDKMPFDAVTQKWNYTKKWYYGYDKSNYIMDKMADLYLKKGNYGKAYLCLYSIYGLKFYPHVETAKSVIALMDKPKKNIFEQYLLEKEKIKERVEVVDILGTALMADGRFYEAKHVFSTIPNYGELIVDPFESRSGWRSQKNEVAEKYTNHQ